MISLLPATLVVCVWRVVYVSAGFGVRSLGGYVDPGYEPLYFVRQLAVRVNALLGGQLSGVPPEVSLLFSPGWQAVFPLFFASFNLACAVVLLPLLRRDAVARFWAVVMILALVPAATVAPLSKNLAFVSVGAFGMLAGLLLRFARREERAALGRPLRVLSWGLVLWLVVAHVPGALVGRALMARVGPLVPRVVAHWCSFSEIPNFGGHDVVVVNNALLLSTLAAPFYRAYYGQPLPRSLNSLAPGCTRLTATRPDDRTLVLTATDADLFQCDPVGPFHFCYGLQAAVDFIAGGRRWTAGERLARNGYGVEVQQVSPAGLPSKVAFRFNRPLESANLVWVFFDWQRLRYSPFTPPRVGESCEIDGPRPL